MPNSTRAFYTLLGIIVAAHLAFGIVFFGKNQQYRNKILPNIYIDNISVAGLTKEQAQKNLEIIYQGKDVFTVQFNFENTPISTLSATEIHYRLPIQEMVDHAYLIGRTSKKKSALYQRIALFMNWQSHNFELIPTFDEEYVKTKLKDLNEAYMVRPQEARFEFQNNKVSAFQLDKNGYELEIQSAFNKIKADIQQQKYKPKSLLIALLRKQITYPRSKLSDINTFGITELIAQGQSQFIGSSPERIHNIKTGSERLNGIIIKPDETFSFVKEIGDISLDTGFKQAWVISGNRTVLGDGGGICQVSTTMFRAALAAGLPIIERTAHAYRVGYYEQDTGPGFDATVFSPSVDLKFKNNYENALLIQTKFDPVSLRLSFLVYGTRDNRQVELSNATVWNVSGPPPTEYIDDYSLPLGITRQIDFAAGGASSKFSYKVVKNGSVLFEEEFFSHFKPWKAIYLVGKKSV